jgi:hypothetical protein
VSVRVSIRRIGASSSTSRTAASDIAASVVTPSRYERTLRLL